MASDKNAPADWQELLTEHQHRLTAGRAMGGAEKLKKRRASGQLSARELVDLFCDNDSFAEIGTLAGSLSWENLPSAPADALVCGSAKIAGREVLIGAEDFTVQGGSIGPVTNAKRVRLAKIAHQTRVPLIMLLDGAGERITNGLQRHAYAPNDMQELASLSGLVPTIAVVIGSSAGHGAITALLMDFVIMLGSATMFAAGPPLVAAAMGETISKEELGSAAMHTGISGVAHNIARDAAHASEVVRQYLSYLPQNAWDYPPKVSASTANKSIDGILKLIPRAVQTPYSIHPVIELLVDDTSFFEFQPRFGETMVTGFARLVGHSVAIVANQPNVMAGSINASAAEKAARFIDIANAFHLPVIFLADNPGILSGSQAEREGTLRAAAKMYAAQARLTSPKLHVTLRKAFGFGSSLMAMNPFDGQTITLALPGITLGGMPVAGGGQAAKLDADTTAEVSEVQSSGAWSTGDSLAYDEIIEPQQLRETLIRALELSLNRRTEAARPIKMTGIHP
ncbi:MAG: acyl-CoA carboxylase subunit beta, partial [Pseudomonadales bacterium]